MGIDNDENENMATPFFDPKLEDKFCPFIKECSLNERHRLYMGKLWDAFHRYAQPDFHKTILTNEEKSFSLMWEMHLAHQFVTHGFALCKTRNEEPDLRLDINGQTVWVECCIPDKGESEPEKVDGVEIHPDQLGKCGPIDPNRVILRWTNALDGKFKQYQKRINDGTCTPDQPYIIAINGHKAGLWYCKGDMPDLMKAVYGVGDLVITLNRDGGSGSHYPSRDSIDKKENTPISTRFFCDETHKGITGVIYTQDSLFSLISGGKDYCYVENVISPHRGDFGFGCFMGTFDYSSDGASICISLKKPES